MSAAADPWLLASRARFALPGGLTYLNGNSLGPPTHAALARLEEAARAEWAQGLVRSWNDAGWVDLPLRTGAAIAPLIGAPPERVIAGDSTSANLFKALAAALALRPDRRVILTDRGNFPSDIYVAQGLARLLGQGHAVRAVGPEAVADAIGPDVAVLMLTDVDYRTGRLHDMARLTARAHAAGALAVWDLAHSAGALALDVAGAGADFAVGCGYKYLNGGPGAPAFLYVAAAHADAWPPVAGWFGHAAPFAFEPDYRPAPGVARMMPATPPILSMTALAAALDAFTGTTMAELRARSLALTQRFMDAVDGLPGFALATPRAPAERGSQVSLRHPEGYGVVRALADRGVVADFRAPDIVRFGFAPLYNGPDDADRAAAALAAVARTRAWDRPQYRTRAAVT